MLIEVFSSFDEFKKYMDEFVKSKKDVWNKQLNILKGKIKGKDNKFKKISEVVLQREWVLQKYLTEPLLFEGKKFHIRPLMLYHKKGNQKIGYLFHKILVAHAYEDFKLDDYHNKRIHDTHFASASRRLYFREDFITLGILNEK
jgi:hypothetical protein